jgi:hypothetical protein
MWAKKQENKFDFIKVIPSNPCIETWFCLHYEETLPRLMAQEMKSRLKTHNLNYEEKYDIFKDIKDKLNDAKNRAIKLNKKYEDINLYNGTANPSTIILKLIEKLESI